MIVSHDLGYALAYADRNAVLKSGQLEELSSADAFVRAPQSAYGKDLMRAALL